MDDLVNFPTPELKEIVSKYSHFLVEVRKRLFATFILFVTVTFIGFFFYEPIIRSLIQLLDLNGINIVFTSPFQFINLAISCGVSLGIIVCFPLLVSQVIFFLKPALRKKEYNLIVRLIPFAFILFVLGFIFGAVIMKWQIEIFVSKSVSLGIGNILDISKLLTTVILTSVLMGVAFQFPIFLLVFLKIGLIKRHWLIKYRTLIYVASLIFAIVLPPDSIIADFLLSLPLIVLFELTLFIDKSSRRGRSGS